MSSQRLVSRREAKQLEREADEAMVKEKKIKQLLVRGESLEEFWWESLTSKICTEEMLDIKPLKPITARHALGIDVYEAKGLYNRLKLRTVGDLYKKYVTATMEGVTATQELKNVLALSCSNPGKAEKIMVKICTRRRGNEVRRR